MTLLCRICGSYAIPYSREYEASTYNLCDVCYWRIKAKRKPLTDEQISAIVQSMCTYTWDAHMLARAVERAHGIIK